MSKNVHNNKTIQEQYLECLESTFRNHFRGNTSAERWELHTTGDRDKLMTKLRLTLSWVLGPSLGSKSLELTPIEVMKNIVDEYRKYRHESFMIAKYENMNR